MSDSGSQSILSSRSATPNAIINIPNTSLEDLVFSHLFHLSKLTQHELYVKFELLWMGKPRFRSVIDSTMLIQPLTDES